MSMMKQTKRSKVFCFLPNYKKCCQIGLSDYFYVSYVPCLHALLLYYSQILDMHVMSGSLVDTGLLWIYGFRPQCETFQGWGVSVLKTILKKPCWWEWRDNGLSSLKNYHQGTLTMPLLPQSKLFLHRAASKRCQCVQQSAAQRKNACWKHFWNIN